VQKLVTISGAYLLSLLMVVAVFAIPAICEHVSSVDTQGYFGLSAFDLILIIFIFAFLTTVVPFSVMRFCAGRSQYLNYKFAAAGGAILGAIGFLFLGVLGAGIGDGLWLIVVFGAIGLVSGLLYWWLEQRITAFWQST